MKSKVSDYIFKFLEDKGVDTAFSISGGAAAHLLDSISKTKIKLIFNKHEQACAMAADAYFRVAGKPALVLITNGPGSTNTITGVLGAYQDSIPVIVVSGQVTTNNLMEGLGVRQIGVQESDIIPMVSPITKYAKCITDATTIQKELELAYQEATTGRFGPVWLDVPLDIQSAQIEVEESKRVSEFWSNVTDKDEHLDYINLIASDLKESKRPLLVVGHGVRLANSIKLLEELQCRLQIPVVSTWNAKDMFDHDDPQYIGNFGILGERAANFAIQKSDFLIILGSRMSIPQVGYQFAKFSPNSVKVMVDVDSAELKKPTLKIDYPVQMHLKEFLEKLLVVIKDAAFDSDVRRGWQERTLVWKKKYPVYQKEYGDIVERINSFHFMEVLSKSLRSGDIVVTDMGTSFTCTMQSLKVRKDNRLFTSSGCASMGFGLPGAIGAAVASKGKNRIICICGDGGIQMNIQELQTIRQYDLPIKIFLLNNNGLLAISLMQDNLFNSNYVGSTPESGACNPNFHELAISGYGIQQTWQLSNNSQLESNIDYILEESGTSFCEILMAQHQLLIPRVQSSKDSKGNIISATLDNMFPYLSKEEMESL